MPLQLVAASDQDVAGTAPYDDEIVGDDAMAALDEVEHALRLADAALADEQEPHAVHVGERAVDGRLRRERIVEPGLDPVVELVRLECRPQDGDVRLRRFLDDVGGQLEPLRDEHARHREAEELREVGAARLRVEREEVGDLGLAEHLQPFGDEALDVAGQGEARARDVRPVDDALEPLRSLDALELQQIADLLQDLTDLHRGHVHPIMAEDGVTPARDRDAPRSLPRRAPR